MSLRDGLRVELTSRCGKQIHFDKAHRRKDSFAMTVSLPKPLAEFIHSKIDAGEFHSVEEVVCEGLRLLQEQDSWKSEAAKKIDIGWEQAKSGQLRTPDVVRENLTERKEAWRKSRGGRSSRDLIGIHRSA